MQIKETKSAGLTKTFSVVIPAADMAREMESELKTLGGRVKIPGFRPGFVPMKVLKQRYGQSIEGDVIKNAVNNATQKVVSENKLRIAMQPDVKVEDYKEEGDLTFTLAVETLPEMPQVNFDKISIERETFEITEAEIDEAMQRLAERNPNVVKQDEKTPAAKKDVVTMSFEGRVDGELFEGGKADKFSVEIGSGRLIDTFETQLIGLKTGDTKKVKVRFPENYFNAELAGKDATFDVTVQEVAKLETPELTEEFAKQRGFADLRALREAVRNQMIREYDSVVRTRLKKRLFDALEKECDFELPSRMVEMEFNTIWDRLQQARKESPGIDVYEGKAEDEVRKEYKKISERRVRLGIFLAEVGNRESLQVTREEMTQAIMQHANQFPGQEQAVYDYYRKNPARLDELRGPILEEKAVDWIITKVKLNDRKVETQELREDPEGEGDSEKPKKKGKK